MMLNVPECYLPRMFIIARDYSPPQKSRGDQNPSVFVSLDYNSHLSETWQVEVKSEAQYNDCGMTRSDAIMILIFLMIYDIIFVVSL